MGSSYQEPIEKMRKYIEHLKSVKSDVEVSIRVYKQLITSEIDYCCFIYGDASKHRISFRIKPRSCLDVILSSPIYGLCMLKKYIFSPSKEKFVGI